MPELEIRLSGAIEVRSAEGRIDLPGRRVRTLLVLLALSAGRTVPVDTLARGIWDDDPPENVRGSLQTYVGRLRRALGADLVVTEATGYALLVPNESVDLLRFEGLVAKAAEDDDPASARARLAEALSLWTGDPFGEAPSDWIERQLTTSWTERYLQTLERRTDLDLSLGDHAARVPELRDVIEQHPLRETLWERLLTALDLAGRTADALERYEVLRNRLASDLGVDPSPELQAIHRRLLTKEAPRTPAAGETGPDRPAVPRQLPPRIGGFTGRDDQLRGLDELIADGAELIAVHGPGGVGKTSLAVHWAAGRRDRFPDGQLFVDLRGYGPGEPVDPLEALDTLLRGLGVPGSHIPADTESRSALLRTELSDRRMLVVLDNAREAAQVRPLLGSGSTTTVVTSRSQLRGLASREGARRIAVEPMPPDDAVALLADRFGPATHDNVTELAELADLCGCLPVALAVAAERAGRDSRPRIAEVNKRLRDERDRIGALTDWADDPLTDVRAVFSWSYQALDADVARLFRLLGRHPDSRIAVGPAAALAGVDERTAERLLDRLAERHLLTEVALGWYEMHDLPRAYATELASTEPDETATAVRRLRSWYLHSVRTARHTQSKPQVTFAIPDPLPGISPARFSSIEQALRWFSAHHRGIRLLLNDAAADGDDALVAHLTPLLYRFFKQIGAGRDATDLFTLAESCAERTGDPVATAVCTYFLGECLDLLGDIEASLSKLEAARAMFACVDHPNGRLAVEISLGAAYAKLDRLEEAVTMQEAALIDSHRVEDSIVAVILNNLATTYLALGRVREATETAQRAVVLDITDDGDPENLATHYVTLSEAQAADSCWVEAVRSLDEAVRLFGESGDVARRILARQLRGTAYRELGDRDAARADWTAALGLLGQLGRDRVPTHRVPIAGTQDELRRLLDDLGGAP